MVDIESGIGGKEQGEDILKNNKLQQKEIATDSLINVNRLKATDKGELVHKVLEYMNKQ